MGPVHQAALLLKLLSFPDVEPLLTVHACSKLHLSVFSLVCG